MQPIVGDYTRIYDPSARESKRWYVNDHSIIRAARGGWHLIGIAHPEPMAPFDELNLLHATAPRLHGPWTRRADALWTDHAAGETHLWAPHLLHYDGRYWMFYCAGGVDNSRYRIHLATSDDLTTWTRHAANPMIVDGFEARDPMVLRVENRWLMYYTATLSAEGGNFVVAAAESDDLIHWRGRHIVYADALSGTGAGPTESPFVVARGGYYYLFIGPDYETLVRSHRETGRYDMAAYRRTRVLVSEDPLAFRLDQQIATVPSHALEVVVDEQQQYWVTHCGWGQGGVYLAPLSWRSPDESIG